MTTQDRHLVAEHDDLKLFGVCRSEQKGDKLQDPLQANRNDGQEHGFSLRKVRHFTQIQLTHPTGTRIVTACNKLPWNSRRAHRPPDGIFAEDRLHARRASRLTLKCAAREQRAIMAES